MDVLDLDDRAIAIMHLRLRSGDGNRDGRMCSHVVARLSSAWSSWRIHAWSAGGSAALGHSGYQFVAGLEIAIEFLDQFGEGMVGDPGFDSYRLKRLVGKLLPHYLSIVSRARRLSRGRTRTAVCGAAGGSRRTSTLLLCLWHGGLRNSVALI